MISPGASRAYARDARVCGVRTARVVSSTTASTHGAHRATVRVIGTTMRRRGGVGVGRAKATDDDEADAADDTEGEGDSASVVAFGPVFASRVDFVGDATSAAAPRQCASSSGGQHCGRHGSCLVVDVQNLWFHPSQCSQSLWQVVCQLRQDSRTSPAASWSLARGARGRGVD